MAYIYDPTNEKTVIPSRMEMWYSQPTPADLGDIPGMNPEGISKLEKLGITNVHQLFGKYLIFSSAPVDEGSTMGNRRMARVCYENFTKWLELHQIPAEHTTIAYMLHYKAATSFMYWPYCYLDENEWFEKNIFSDCDDDEEKEAVDEKTDDGSAQEPNLGQRIFQDIKMTQKAGHANVLERISVKKLPQPVVDKENKSRDDQ